jgi:hypothetical protein
MKEIFAELVLLLAQQSGLQSLKILERKTFLELSFLILFWPFLLWLSFVVSHFSFLSSLICFNLSSALHIFHLCFCSFYNCLFFHLFDSFFSFLWWLCRCQINPAIWMKRLRCICLSKDSRHYFSCSSWGKLFLPSFFLFVLICSSYFFVTVNVFSLPMINLV